MRVSEAELRVPRRCQGRSEHTMKATSSLTQGRLRDLPSAREGQSFQHPGELPRACLDSIPCN